MSNARELESADRHSPAAAADMPPLVQRVRDCTPARLLVGRSGAAYRTATQLELRRDHAAALDAVHAEIDLARDFGAEFVSRWNLFEVCTAAATKAEYLMRPDLGRRLHPDARAEVAKRCPRESDLQVVIGDGLSATAVITAVPDLLPRIAEHAAAIGWSIGQPFLVRHCRVGVLNDVGELLYSSDPSPHAAGPRGVVVLLIGERPGLATAESLSAYMAYRPRPGHSDADRNLISNIHRRGVPIAEAARRIVALAERMAATRSSGVALKEELPEPNRTMKKDQSAIEAAPRCKAD